MITVRDLIRKLSTYPTNARLAIVIKTAEGHTVSCMVEEVEHLKGQRSFNGQRCDDVELRGEE